MAEAFSGSSDLSAFYDSRYVKPTDLLRTFNPQHLKASGLGGDGIGADPAATGPFYVFVTCPDLNILSDEARTYLAVGKPTAPEAIAKLLTGGVGVIKLLTNLVENIGV